MKKSALIMLTAALAFTACQVMETTPLEEGNVLSAVIEQDDMTKTVMDDNNNILWSENDQIVAFMESSYGHKYQVKPAFAGKSYADFSRVTSGNGNDLSAGNEWEHNIAYYPYSETIECLKSGDHYALEVVLPSEQTYVAESFGNGAMAMVAVSEDNDITFRNVLGGMKLQLKGSATITSIKVEGKNNEKLSGAAVVTAYTDGTKPSITMSSDASTSVTLNCFSGIQLNEQTATEFIITIPPVIFSKGFTVTITDTEGNEYELDSGKQNEVKRSSLLVMPPIDIQEIVVSTRMLKLVSVDYDSYQVQITVPETVGPDGNIIRYNFGNEAIDNENINIGHWSYDLILQYNGGERNTTDVNKTITIQETIDNEGGYLIEPIAPGEPTVFIAGEYTRDGQLVGEPEIIRFKTKEPSVLNEEIDVEVSDISAIDATITIVPDSGIYLYCMLVLDEATYNYLLQNIVSETDLQWFVSSYYAMYNYGAYPLTGSIETQLRNYFIDAPPADTKYHILITGMGDRNGTSQCFKHIEFHTDKKRLSPPSILVTPLPEKSTPNSAVFNIKCTSANDPNAGMCVKGAWGAAYDFEWGTLTNNGFTVYSSLKENGIPFSAEELAMINSNDGYEMSVSSCDGMTMRLGVIGYNEEHTPNDLNYDDIRQCPAIADIKTPFLVKPSVDSEFLTTDILEGDWIMTATDANGNPLETTVSIIRGYKAGRDYPAEFSGEAQFLEQAEIFNQKRLEDKNSLLMQGWFPDNQGDYNFSSPYDLLISQDYVAYDYQQLFFEAGPKMFIEVDETGSLVVRTGEEYMPATCWTGGYYYYTGYSPLADTGFKYQYIDYPITISDDKKTMVISSVYGSYLNLILKYGYHYGHHVLIQSDIVLKKK